MTQPHHRRSIRLSGYDYTSAGAYFITICTHGRDCLFGRVVDGEMQLNALGELVRAEWEKSGTIRAEIELGPYVIMPNHFHGIIWIIDDRGRGTARDGGSPYNNNPRTIRQTGGRVDPDHRAHSNPRLPGKSTRFAKPPARRSGSAITGSTSSVMKKI